jgi:hypothetical protein
MEELYIGLGTVGIVIGLVLVAVGVIVSLTRRL